MKIKRVAARKILNSRKEETIEITINNKWSASAPSGASKGKHEVKAFPKQGVPVRFVNRTLNDEFRNFKVNVFEDFEEVEDIFRDYDDTKNLSQLGGNIIIAFEYALLRALSNGAVWKFLNPLAQELPKPVGNCIGGGAHFKGVAPDIQEFLLIPDTQVFQDAAFANDYAYRIIGQELGITDKTDEGAWAPKLSNLEVLNLLERVTERVESEVGFRVKLGLDVAASQLWNGRGYNYKNFGGNKKSLSKEEQLEFINDLITRYDISYVEDAFHEEDFESFSQLKNDLIVGDDLICTDIGRLRKAINSVNALIVKPNQVGSLVKTAEIIEFAKQNDVTPVISHRSGETMDTMISDLAVGFEVPYIKCGIYGKERTAKINRLKTIENQL